MSRYIVYLCPFLVNMLQGGMFFITAYRFSEAGAPKWVITGTMAMWAAVYALTSGIVSRLVTEKRAVKMILGATAGLFLTSLGALLCPSLNMQYFWLFTLGCSAAFYCAAFQLFCKKLESDSSGGIVRSTALYTASWSFGLATGPFIFGMLSWQAGYVVNTVMSVVIAAAVLYANAASRKSGSATPATNIEEPPSQDSEYSGRPDLIWMAWTGAFLGTCTIAIVRTLEPALAVELGIGQFHAGMVLAMVSYVQAIVALLLIFGRQWMYRAKAIIAFSVCGIASLFLMGFTSRLALLYLAAIIYGIFSAGFYFCLVFHALVHPTKSVKYVPINEMIVGFASVFAPFLGGLVAQHFSISEVFYASAAVILISMTLQLLLIRKAR
ncbi:MAG: MFS transporter [Lentisphaeria bacterium]|nr:MFS transporter [Lentisphaeria bacterium]